MPRQPPVRRLHARHPGALPRRHRRHERLRRAAPIQTLRQHGARMPIQERQPRQLRRRMPTSHCRTFPHLAQRLALPPPRELANSGRQESRPGASWRHMPPRRRHHGCEDPSQLRSAQGGLERAARCTRRYHRRASRHEAGEVHPPPLPWVRTRTIAGYVPWQVPDRGCEALRQLMLPRHLHRRTAR